MYSNSQFVGLYSHSCLYRFETFCCRLFRRMNFLLIRNGFQKPIQQHYAIGNEKKWNIIY